VGGVAEATRDSIGIDAFRTLYFSTATREQHFAVQNPLTPREDPMYTRKFYPEVKKWTTDRSEAGEFGKESNSRISYTRKAALGVPAVLQSPGNVGAQLRLGVAPPAEANSMYQDSFKEFKDPLKAIRTRIDPDSYMGQLGCLDSKWESVNNAEFDLKPMKPNPPFRPFENIDTLNHKRRTRTDKMATVPSTYESSYHHPPIKPIDWSQEYLSMARGGVLLNRENTEAFRAHSSEKHKRSRWGGPL
jgi:hypothetical protein